MPFALVNASSTLPIQEQSISHETPVAPQEKPKTRQKRGFRSSAYISEENLFEEETSSKDAQRSRKLQYKVNGYDQYHEHSYLAPSSWWKAGNGGSMSYDYQVQCETKTACGDCLSNGCAWSNEKCVESCSRGDETECYSFENFPKDSKAEICKIAKDRTTDNKACGTTRANQGCKACMSTPLPSDPSKHCKWNDEFGTCQAECNSLGCVKSTCKPDADDDEKACQTEKASQGCKSCMATPLASNSSKRCRWNDELQTCQSKCNFANCELSICKADSEDDAKVCSSNNANQSCEACSALQLLSDPSKNCKWNSEIGICQDKCNSIECESSTCKSRVATDTPTTSPTFFPTLAPQTPIDTNARFRRTCSTDPRQDLSNAREVIVTFDYSAETLNPIINDPLLEKIEFVMLNDLLDDFCKVNSRQSGESQSDEYEILGGSILQRDVEKGKFSYILI